MLPKAVDAGRDDRENRGKRVEPAMAGHATRQPGPPPGRTGQGHGPVDPIANGSTKVESRVAHPDVSAPEVARDAPDLIQAWQGVAAAGLPGSGIRTVEGRPFAGPLKDSEQEPEARSFGPETGVVTAVCAPEPATEQGLSITDETPSAEAETILCGHAQTLEVTAEAASWTPVDSPGGSGSDPGRAERRSRVPPRIAARPETTLWSDDELLTLPEAAALFWPAGPITVHTLRTAARDRSLAITVVARKHFTTPLAIRRMGAGEVVPKSEVSTVTPDQALAARIEEVRSGRRGRRRRAA